jgi:hypothetical protein
MASVGAQSAYATDIVAVQRVYYDQVWNFACLRIFVAVAWSMADAHVLQDQWMLVMSTQLIGFSIGGLGQRFLVAPASMSKFPCVSFPACLIFHVVWPNTLVSCALLNTLHSQSYAGIGQHEGVSRERYFLYAFLAALAWC